MYILPVRFFTPLFYGDISAAAAEIT